MKIFPMSLRLFILFCGWRRGVDDKEILDSHFYDDGDVLFDVVKGPCKKMLFTVGRGVGELQDTRCGEG